MKKKKVIYIGILIVIISSLLTLVVLKGRKPKSNVYKVYTEIHDKMDNKDSFLVYFRNDNPYRCITCDVIDDVVEFYKDVYGLNFLIFDTDYRRDLVQLNLDFKFEPEFIQNPAILIVKDGEWKSVANDISDEVFLKEQLIANGFIEEKYANIETEIIDDKVFDELLKSDKSTLIVVNSNKSADMKKLLYNMAINDSYFQYYSIIKGNLKNYNSFMKLWDLTGDEMKDTTLVVIKGDKVVSSISSFDQKKIRKFLKKNGFIKN